jgi:hypothetical protein
MLPCQGRAIQRSKLHAGIVAATAPQVD